MRKEKLFLGYENEKEIVESVNIYTKKEMIEIFENHEKELQERYSCIHVGTPLPFKVSIENMKKMDESDEFIFNHVTKDIEMYVI